MEEEDDVANICVYPLVLVAEAVVAVVAEREGRMVLAAEGVVSAADSAAMVVKGVVAMVRGGCTPKSSLLPPSSKFPCLCPDL